MSSMFFQMEFATLYKNLKFNLKVLLQNCLGSQYRKFALFLFINPLKSVWMHNVSKLFISAAYISNINLTAKIIPETLQSTAAFPWNFNEKKPWNYHRPIFLMSG